MAMPTSLGMFQMICEQLVLIVWIGGFYFSSTLFLRTTTGRNLHAS